MAVFGLKPEGLACRLYSVFGFLWLRLHRLLGLPIWLMPVRRLRQVDKLWPKEMQDKYIRSFGKKLPHDEPCTLCVRVLSPRTVLVPQQNRLNTSDIQRFYENGFLQPFDAFDPSEIKKIGNQLKEQRQWPSLTYGFPCDRDRHLEDPAMLQAMKNPTIVDRLKQLLGPDLIAWRSQIFYKPPFGKTVGWHQASTYMFEMGFTDQTLVPPNLNELFMLTVWIPCDPVTLENGCMQFVKGSLQQGIKNMKLGGSIGFHSVNFFPDYEVDAKDIISVEMKPGQVLIFSERTIHGSPANKTNKPRMAFNYRVVPVGVKIYPDPKGEQQHRDFHKSAQMAEQYDLTRWKAVQLCGLPNNLNRILK